MSTLELAGLLVAVALAGIAVGAYAGVKATVRRLRTTAGRDRYGVRMIIRNPDPEEAGLDILTPRTVAMPRRGGPA